MVEDVGAVAAGVLKGVGQDRQAVESPLLIDTFGKGDDCGREPRRFEGNGAEWVSEDVSEKVGVSPNRVFQGNELVREDGVQPACDVITDGDPDTLFRTGPSSLGVLCFLDLHST